MARKFTPYPIPENRPEVHPVAQAASGIQNALQTYLLLKQQQDQSDVLKQQRAIDILKLRSDVDPNFDWNELSSALGGQSPAKTPPMAAAPLPTAPPSPLPGMASQGIAPIPTAAGAAIDEAPTTPTGLLGITPDYVRGIRNRKLREKAAKTYQDEQSFMLNQQKGAVDLAQNAPASPEEVRAALSVFGEPGIRAAEALIEASPTGTKRTLLGNTQSALANMTKMQYTQPPPGYQWTQQGTLQPVAGGPAARDIADKQAKVAAAQESAKGQAQRVMTKVDQAIGLVNKWTAGPGALLQAVPGSQAKNLAADIDTIQSILGFEALQTMRNNSPTGGALGQVAVRELELLQAQVSSLDARQSPDQVRRNLGEIKQHYQNWLDTVNQAKVERGGPAPLPNAADAAAVPAPAPTGAEPPNGQQTVKQGEFTYTWNPVARRYE